MGSKSCMNEGCRVTTSSEWKSGWALKFGGFATLCVSCGLAYEKSTYCGTFHLDEDGWRECIYCRKRVHCGCSASKTLLEILDFGGVGCASCVRQMEARANASTASIANASTASLAPVQGPVQVSAAEVAKVTLAKDVVPTAGSVLKRRNFGEMFLDGDGSRKLHRMQKCGTSVAEPSLGQNKGEGPVAPFGEKFSTGSPHFTDQPVAASPVFARPESQRAEQRKELYEAPSLGRSSLNISLNSHLPAPSLVAPFSNAPAEGSDQSKVFSPHRRPPQLLPKPPKPVLGPSSSSEAARGGMAFQARIARPPVEGRGRCQLLPRYWPRITEQELQQISGDLKSPIVPLFEKVLSASDAGRIGRLVLPKACAEAYFPTINQSEGLPINIQDVKGKEWTFQFRFWPNNNSRMYVLEGVTPCIQNMNLQAGDTVTFSRRDPGGQLVMGFRKSTSNVDTHEPQSSVLPYHGGSPGDTSHSGDGMIVLETGKNGGHTAEDSLPAPTLVSEKKKARNLGTKNKRLHMHDDDAVELRVTWEEAQELLRPPPMNSPTVVKIDNYEFEEYNEPPIFGKKTVFTVGPSGQQEQWTQCDGCRKWRKLPVHVLVPARWTCPDNIWDANSASCLAADVINPREQESLHIASRDYGRRIGLEQCEPSGLDALATAAVLGGDGDLAEASVGATTKHPRHRPGCSCIVCIQPPSGKGKHPGNCKCTVCLTVKRRFKTLMQRKKKRQSDREAELAQGLLNQGSPAPMDLSEMDGAAEAAALLQMTQMEAAAETAAKGGGLDLNCHPGREDDMLAEAAAGISMDLLMDAAGVPLDMYLRQNQLSRPDAGGDAGGGSSSSAPGPGKRVDEDSERV